MRDDPSARDDSPLAPADVLWAIGSLCNLHRRAFDAAAYARRAPPPHTLERYQSLTFPYAPGAPGRTSAPFRN